MTLGQPPALNVDFARSVFLRRFNVQRAEEGCATQTDTVSRDLEMGAPIQSKAWTIGVKHRS